MKPDNPTILVMCLLGLNGCASYPKTHGSYSGIVYESKPNVKIVLIGIDHGIFFSPCGFQTARDKWTIKIDFHPNKDRTYNLRNRTHIEHSGINFDFSDGEIKIDDQNKNISVLFYKTGNEGRQYWEHNAIYPIRQYSR